MSRDLKTVLIIPYEDCIRFPGLRIPTFVDFCVVGRVLSRTRYLRLVILIDNYGL